MQLSATAWSEDRQGYPGNPSLGDGRARGWPKLAASASLGRVPVFLRRNRDGSAAKHTAASRDTRSGNFTTDDLIAGEVADVYQDVPRFVKGQFKLKVKSTFEKSKKMVGRCWRMLPMPAIFHSFKDLL